MPSLRSTFTSRMALLATMVGVAVGLGNVWRFPYLVGRFGGAAFVLLYLLFALLIGVPALMAEWTLGRSTERGPVGAFERVGLPAGRWIGVFFFVAVTVATGYYTNAIGWVVYHAAGQITALVGISIDAGAILPPPEGFQWGAFAKQALLVALLLSIAASIMVRGLRRGIEAVSLVVTPLLFGSLLVLIARSVTLPGAFEGVEWFIGKFDPAAMSGTVAVAALGQVIFSLALGGTFMVVYGSYLSRDEPLERNALFTVFGDTAAGLLAGFAIFPAVFALGLEPGSGPGLIFATLPDVFSRIPLGGLFGALFFTALAGAAFLSAIAALEVLVAGLTDNLSVTRTRAVWTMVTLVFVVSLPSMVNLRVFERIDLTFGSGLQTLGALLAAVAVGWAMDRSTALRELGGEEPPARIRLLYVWIRFVIPTAILLVGGWWLATDVLGILSPAA